MKKFLSGCIIISLTILLGLVVFIIASSPDLPPDADKIISEVQTSEIPELIKGDTGYAISGDINIWYETIKPTGEPKGTILLIMGLGGDAIEWPSYFYQPMIDSGYQVIRFDNRSTGNSDKIENYNSDNPYLLEDMALDAIAVLDANNIEQVHIVGMSMGGMIGQILAIQHPRRVCSLTSIMSSAYTNDPELPDADREIYIKLLATALRYGASETERGAAKLTVAVRTVLTPYLSPERIQVLSKKTIYNLRNRQPYFVGSFRQHFIAISASGSRIEALRKLTIPTLVVHGKSDPLIPIEHGIKMASLIKGAKGVWIEGMGHDIGPEHVDRIHENFFSFISRNNN